MITDPQHQLVLGAVDFTDPTSGLCVLSDSGNSWGSPQAVTSVVDSLLMDGSLVKWQRDDNRTVTFLVRASGSDSIELAEAEARLVGELYQRNGLEWTPPDGLGPTTVFQVLTSEAAMVAPPSTSWDEGELNLVRCYQVTLTCAPHALSSSPSTVSSIAQASGSPTVISSGASATGWSAGVTSSGGFLVESTAYSTWTADPRIQYNGTTTWGGSATFTFGTAQNMTTTPFLWVDSPAQTTLTYLGTTFTVGGVSPRLKVNGATASVAPLMQFTSPDDATCIRYVFSVGGFSAVTTLKFDFQGQFTSGAGVGAPSPFKWKNVVRAANVPGTSTNETLLSFAVGGSVRAPGSLNISSASTTVGDALIYTAPDLANGYIPSMRRYRTSGGTVSSDSSAWSGFSEPVSTGGVVFNVPAATLAEGGYVLMGRVKSFTLSSSQSYTWTAQLKLASGGSVGPVLSSVVGGPVSTGSSWSLFNFGAIMLPATLVPVETTSSVTISFPSIAGLIYDDFYLMRRGDDTALTIVSGAAKNLWIDSPTIEQPSPRLYTGTSPSRSDAYGFGSAAISWEQHVYTPGITLAYVACSAPDAVATLTYTKRWHTNAAEDGG